MRTCGRRGGGSRRRPTPTGTTAATRAGSAPRRPPTTRSGHPSGAARRWRTSAWRGRPAARGPAHGAGRGSRGAARPHRGGPGLAGTGAGGTSRLRACVARWRLRRVGLSGRPRARRLGATGMVASVAGPATGCRRRGGRLRGRAGGDGTGGVGDPVGPGADVEGGGNAGQREREDLVGRGDAGPAVGAHRAVTGRAEGREAGGQVAGAWNVPSGFTFCAVGALTAPGMWPATGSTCSLSPVYRSPRGRRAAAVSGDRRRAVGVEQAQLAGARGEAPGARRPLAWPWLHRVGRPRSRRGSHRRAPGPTGGRSSAAATRPGRRRWSRRRRRRPRAGRRAPGPVQARWKSAVAGSGCGRPRRAGRPGRGPSRRRPRRGYARRRRARARRAAEPPPNVE